MATKGKSTKLSQAEIEDIAGKNPAVKLEEVSEALQIIRELHKIGITGSRYNVRSPYNSSPIHSAGDDAWPSGSIEDTGTDGC